MLALERASAIVRPRFRDAEFARNRRRAAGGGGVSRSWYVAVDIWLAGTAAGGAGVAATNPFGDDEPTRPVRELLLPVAVLSSAPPHMRDRVALFVSLPVCVCMSLCAFFFCSRFIPLFLCVCVCLSFCLLPLTPHPPTHTHTHTHTPAPQAGRGSVPPDAVALLPEDPNQPCCALSGEPFEKAYDQDTDAWMFRGARRLTGETGGMQLAVACERAELANTQAGRQTGAALLFCVRFLWT